MGHARIFGDAWCDDAGDTGKGRGGDEHDEHAGETLSHGNVEWNMRDRETAHEPTGKESDPPGRQETDFGHDDSFRLAFVQIVELVKLEFGEVFVTEREGYLVMNDSVDSGDQ